VVVGTEIGFADSQMKARAGSGVRGLHSLEEYVDALGDGFVKADSIAVEFYRLR
jgi:hypothetical protein